MMVAITRDVLSGEFVRLTTPEQAADALLLGSPVSFGIRELTLQEGLALIRRQMSGEQTESVQWRNAW